MHDPTHLPPPDRAKRSSQFHSRLLRLRLRLQRHWWIPALAIVVAVGIQGVRLRQEPPSYTSVGQMIVSIKLSIPEGSVYNEEMSNFLGTQVALMQSASVLNRVELRLRTSQPELTPVPVKLAVSVIPKTTIFVLRATGEEPNFTQAYLHACMEEYIQLKKEMRSQTSETTLASITEELGRLERELRKGEEESVNFQASNSVVFLQEQGNSAGSYLTALNRQLADQRTELQLLNLLTLEQNLERKQIGAVGNAESATRALEADTEYLRAKQQIQMLKAEQTQLAEYLRPKHPKMVALTEDITRREKLLTILRQQSQEQLESRRSSLTLQLENLEQQFKEWEAKSLDVSKRMAEYQKIRSNNQRIQGLYDRLLATMQTVGVNKDISPESVTIMQPATSALASVNSMAKSLLIALVLGLAVGVGILLLLDRLDDRMNSFSELEDHFDEPMLGQIPKDRSASAKTSSKLLQPQDERHAFVEAYRNFRSSLLFLSDENPKPRVLLVTSSIPNDGKSLTTANLAITMANGGARVLLIDADLRKGVLHQRFGLASDTGLSEALAGGPAWSQSVQPTYVPNLFLLPRGATTHTSGELFLQASTRQFLAEAAAQFDFVILDTPPVMAADDVSSLAPLVEGVLFVIRAQHTSARVARAALEVLYQRGVKVLGLVFNAVEPSGGEYYYYRYHDYYASYPKAEKKSETLKS
jgi:capsular exopolysaccharide synthesis family protein